jgi:maleylpyruvate isomerase
MRVSAVRMPRLADSTTRERMTLVITIAGFDHYADGPAAAADLSTRLAAASRGLARAATGISDAQAREPSLLPGWTRGHVLTHIARNADSLRNLLIWARTGIETPQYASAGERDAGIAAGAGRPAAELRADVEESAAAFAAEAASMPAPAWDAQVQGLRGPGHPAWYAVWRRLTEVEFHHVDLGTGYRPADWPGTFSGQGLARLAVDFQKETVPRLTLRAAGSGARYEIGPAAPATAGPAAGQTTSIPVVTGPTADLLAWLVGRSDGAGLSLDPPGLLPELPAW